MLVALPKLKPDSGFFARELSMMQGEHHYQFSSVIRTHGAEMDFYLLAKTLLAYGSNIIVDGKLLELRQ